jgi:hypothetical protein
MESLTHCSTAVGTLQHTSSFSHHQPGKDFHNLNLDGIAGNGPIRAEAASLQDLSNFSQDSYPHRTRR